MNWFGGILKIYLKGGNTMTPFTEVHSISTEKAQKHLDAHYPADKYYAIYNPYSMQMEAEKT